MAPIHLGLNEVCTEVDSKGHDSHLRDTEDRSQASEAGWNDKSHVLLIGLSLPSHSNKSKVILIKKVAQINRKLLFI